VLGGEQVSLANSFRGLLAEVSGGPAGPGRAALLTICSQTVRIHPDLTAHTAVDLHVRHATTHSPGRVMDGLVGFKSRYSARS
jgi:hypothetical protein